MNAERAFNIAVELWGIAFCLVGLVCSRFFTHTQQQYRPVFYTLFILTLVTMGGDALTDIFQGQSGVVAWLCIHVGGFIAFAGDFLIIAVLTQYLCKRIADGKEAVPYTWNTCVSFTATAMCVLTAVGLFFEIDHANVLHRSRLYWTFTLFVVPASLVNAALVLRHKRCFDTSGLLCMLYYSLAPMVYAILQVHVFGIDFHAIMLGIGLVLLFFEIQIYSTRVYAMRTEELARSQTELTESRIAAMVSQMQPHFLFNTLDTIYGLCDEDVGLAKEAIASFSRYLRVNVVSLRRVEPVPIATEMEHVRTYLELEKLADPNRLHYELSMDAADFSVPVLCVQAIVENAVKHGLGKRKNGGTVKVSTRELEDEYVVLVEDDGVGYNTAMPPAQGSGTHVGLENTRSRLLALCGGSLEISSIVDLGTTVVIRIPKGDST